jgi:penicillin-binding protein 2A
MDRAVAGKTGTTQVGIESVKDPNANRDLWFVGYTPEWTAAIWMGFPRTDAEHYLKTGSGTPAAMFAEAMSKALKGREPSNFQRPKGAREIARPPQAVADLSAMFEDVERAVYLSWSEVGKNLTYRIYRKANDETDFVHLHDTSGDLLRDHTVELGKTYTYYLVTLDPDSGLTSQPSNTVEIEIPNEDEYSDFLDLPDPDNPEPSDEGTQDGEPGADSEEADDETDDGSDSGSGDSEEPSGADEEEEHDGGTPPESPGESGDARGGSGGGLPGLGDLLGQ